MSRYSAFCFALLASAPLSLSYAQFVGAGGAQQATPPVPAYRVIQPRKITNIPDVYYAPDTRVNIGQAPRVVKHVLAEIPEAQLLALQNDVEIVVRLQLATDGRVAEATVVESNKPEWHPAVLAAARQWQYPPAAYPQTIEVAFRFVPPQ